MPFFSWLGESERGHFWGGKLEQRRKRFWPTGNQRILSCWIFILLYCAAFSMAKK